MAAALLAVAACGSATPASSATPPNAAGGAGAKAGSSAPGPVLTSCPNPGWAYKVTGLGTVAWQMNLPDFPVAYSDPEPVVTGDLSVFGHGDGIYALRLNNGQAAWRRVFPAAADSLAGQVDELWVADRSVIALVGPYGLVSPHTPGADRVVSLNPASGAIRWTLNLGSGDPVYGSLAVTSDGVLALVRQGGALQAVGLAAGKLLWSHPYAHQDDSDGPVASGTVVVAAVKGTVTGFDARTGRVLWRRGGMPSKVEVMAGPGGRMIVYDQFQQGSARPENLFPVTALSAATGKVLWRLVTSGPVAAISAAHGWIAVGTSGTGTSRLYLVNPATGHPRLSVATFVASDMTWGVTATDLVYFMSESLTGSVDPGVTEVVDRRLVTGAVRWSVRLPDWSAGAIAQPSGPDVLVTSFATGPSRILAIDVATGRSRVVTDLPQIPSPPVVTGGSALLALTSPPCAEVFPAAVPTTPAAGG